MSKLTEERNSAMRKHLSLILAITLAASMLSGCGGSDTKAEAKQVKTGETISSSSKWINSDIEGAIDEGTAVSLKDDFYTAVNRDWLLSQTATEDEPCINFFMHDEDVLRERKLAIVKGSVDSEAGENPAGIPEAQLRHDERLLAEFTALASNWEERNEKGTEPIRPYIEAIDSISSIDELTDYIMNKDGMNLSFLLPVSVKVGSTFTNHDVNTVIIGTEVKLTLDSADSYTNISDAGKVRMQSSDASVKLLLGRLGYSGARISQIIRDCYRFEARLAKAGTLVSSATDISSYLAETDNRYELSQLKEIQGDFPLTDILANYGYDTAESYSVTYPKYVSSIGILYNDRYLDELKAYYMVHTLNDCMALLDRDAFDVLQELSSAVSESADQSSDQPPDPYAENNGVKTEAEKEAAILLDNFIKEYLNEPLDQIYIARYCTAQQKAELEALIGDIVDYYRDMLYAEEWLSTGAREKAVEKLEHITVRALYPDSFNDYSALDLSGSDDLVAAVAAINAFAMTQGVEKINTPVDRNAWDLKAMPTTFANAAYMSTDNSINIFAGIIADGSLFDVDDSYEEVLAKIGMIVGHEITHGFDTNGYRFDKDGYYQSWWTTEDIQAFQLRASRLAKFYSGIIPYPGATGYNGENVQGEAIADMGGLKCMLGIAEDIPGFDYELFFRTYAQLWRTKNTYSTEAALSENEHPLNFLRANTVLQQFDKFYETFEINPGDGMYLAPEDRVAVW